MADKMTCYEILGVTRESSKKEVNIMVRIILTARNISQGSKLWKVLLQILVGLVCTVLFCVEYKFCQLAKMGGHNFILPYSRSDDADD